MCYNICEKQYKYREQEKHQPTQLQCNLQCIYLNELLGEVVVEPLQQEGAHTRPGSTSNGVRQNKALSYHTSKQKGEHLQFESLT